MSLPSQTIFRFAPSPNGRLHLGNAYSALYADHWARALGGVALLRIEDIDTTRCRPEFAAGILEDLEWLGLSYPRPIRRQSDHLEEYHAGAERLREMGVLYPCFCSRSEIKAQGLAQVDPAGAPLYAGRCRKLSEAERRAKLAAGHRVAWRLDVSRALELAGEVMIREAMPDPGCPVISRPAQPERWGDVVLVRKDIAASYHLAVVVDDAAQGVTHVTRGLDLYPATDIHVLLQALLGLPAPVYTHHQLIRDEEGEKLAKSRGSERVADLRAAGWSAAAVRHRLGF